MKPAEQVVEATVSAAAYLQQQLPVNASQLQGREGGSQQLPSNTYLPQPSGSTDMQAIVTAETHSRAEVRGSRRLQHAEEQLDTMSQLQGGYQASSRGRSAAVDVGGGTNKSQTSNSHAVYTQQVAVATRQPSAYSVYEFKMSCLTLFVAVAAVSVVQGCFWGIKKVMRISKTVPS